eukprot:scaffold142780_cov38-Cyclotella_meneghiniana.AAC.1
MTVFECDLCHFRNIRKMDPEWGNPDDAFMLMCIRRASLDACWARATSTVTANLKRASRDTLEGSFRTPMRGDEMVPLLGWGQLEDRVGMAPAILSLVASLRPGLYAEHLQVASVRKTRSWYSNAYRAGAGYQRDTIYSRGSNFVVATTSPTDGPWFTNFMKGLKLRQGEVVMQDHPFTSPIVLALDKVCELYWTRVLSIQDKTDVEDFMVYVLMEFCGDLRGEEVTLLSLKGVLAFWHSTTVADVPFVMLTLHGRFKGETGLRWHCIPIPINTKSKLPVLKWFTRALRRRTEGQGRVKGWFFADAALKRRKMSYYEPMLQDHLQTVREDHKGVILDDLELDGFSLRRSGRSGAHTEATNNKVPIEVITTMGRWRKRELARGTQPGMPMVQVYLRVRNAVPTLLAFASDF